MRIRKKKVDYFYVVFLEVLINYFLNIKFFVYLFFKFFIIDYFKINFSLRNLKYDI